MKRILPLLMILAAAALVAQLPKPGGSGGAASVDISCTPASYATITGGTATAGKVCATTDSLYTLIGNGSTWAHYYLGTAMTAPPTASWSWDNQGTGTETQAGGYLYLLAPAAAGGNTRVRYRTSPSAPWTLTACIIPAMVNLSNQQVGIGVRGSAAGKLYLFGPAATATANLMQVVKMTNSTTWSSTPYSQAVTLQNRPVWLRIQDNNTNLLMSFSNDGLNFTQVYSETRAAFLTPDQLIYFSDTQSTSLSAANTLLSWKVE